MHFPNVRATHPVWTGPTRLILDYFIFKVSMVQSVCHWVTHQYGDQAQIGWAHQSVFGFQIRQHTAKEMVYSFLKLFNVMNILLHFNSYIFMES